MAGADRTVLRLLPSRYPACHGRKTTSLPDDGSARVRLAFRRPIWFDKDEISQTPDRSMAAAAPPSPFAPKSLPAMPVVDGVRYATAEAGIRYKGRTDLMVAVFDEGTVAAGVLTQSKTCSAAVSWCRESLKDGSARILVVNSGNANAFTGKRGREAVEITADYAARATKAKPSNVYLASTG